MVNCSAIGCTNRSADQPEISFHQVPTEKKNKSLRKHWLHNIRRAGELPNFAKLFYLFHSFRTKFFKRDLQVY